MWGGYTVGNKVSFFIFVHLLKSVKKKKKSLFQLCRIKERVPEFQIKRCRHFIATWRQGGRSVNGPDLAVKMPPE